MESNGLRIRGIEDGSIAQKLDIKAGDVLLSINNVFINDIIDYLYNCAGNMIFVTVKKQSGEIHRYKIHKKYDKTLGILFEDTIADCPRRCQNRCAFCFVDQMPQGLRKSLYIKDDDYRLSFLDGNFITLTNLNQDDLDRIIKYRLSPLYVSVHATDKEIRNYLLGRNKNDHDVIEILRHLIKNNIKIHSQIVLCPGINDGNVLEKTLDDLSKFYPDILSCAVVPVGLTKFRDRLANLHSYNQKSSDEVLSIVSRWNQKLKDAIGTNFVFPSDEFLVISNRDIPESDYYEGYPQLENGVGMFRKFIDEVHLVKPEKLSIRKKICIITSEAAYKTIYMLLNEYFDINGNIVLKAVKNNFWGGNVNVAGLITATDIMEQ
ncbi:MAG: DUF512 domain-containing protein, partial [Thermoanaerobacteraceae bacterium]|nr:DUF512 domain-containing protein [Thermoanaerobacteraceae bacterium]